MGLGAFGNQASPRCASFFLPLKHRSLEQPVRRAKGRATYRLSGASMGAGGPHLARVLAGLYKPAWSLGSPQEILLPQASL